MELSIGCSQERCKQGVSMTRGIKLWGNEVVWSFCNSSSAMWVSTIIMRVLKLSNFALIPFKTLPFSSPLRCIKIDFSANLRPPLIPPTMCFLWYQLCRARRILWENGKLRFALLPWPPLHFWRWLLTLINSRKAESWTSNKGKEFKITFALVENFVFHPRTANSHYENVQIKMISRCIHSSRHREML